MARKVETEAVGCGTITKRGDWWHFRWTDESGQRHREALKVTTKDAARSKARELAGAIENHNWMPRGDRKQLRLVDVAEEYVKHVRQTAERTGGVEFTLSTAKGYGHQLRLLKGEAKDSNKRDAWIPAAPFVNAYIGSVTPKQIEEWLNVRQDRDGVGLATRNRNLAFVKSVYGWAVKTKGITSNPAARVKVVAREHLDPRRRQTKALTVEELERLLDVLRARGGTPYDVSLAAADTGLRRGSLQALRWEHVDWRDRLLRLPTSKGKKALEITLTGRLYEHLKVMYERARTKTVNGTVLLTASVEELPLFPHRHDVTRPFDNVTKGLSESGKLAGIGHVHLHQLRHTYCTHHAAAGTPAFVLKEMMGHNQLSTTEKYYHDDRESRQTGHGHAGGPPTSCREFRHGGSAVSAETPRRRYGWTCRLEDTERGGKVYQYWRAYKRVGGRTRAIYIGRDWNRETLARFREKAHKIEVEHAAGIQ